MRGKDILVIKGMEENGEKAYRKIRASLDRILTPQNAIIVPKEHHGLVVGNGGCSLKEIQTKCCVTLDVPKADEDREYIMIKGAPENVEEAKLMISEITKKASAKKEVENLF